MFHATCVNTVCIGVAELVRRRQKLSSPRKGMLQHIDEEEENDPNSDKSITAPGL